MARPTCSSCGFMVEPEWHACRFCQATLDGSATERPAWSDRSAAPGAVVVARPRQPVPWGRLAVMLVLVVGILGAADYFAMHKVLGKQPYPERWDPRVRGLVAFIEETHRMRFKHPVHVEFLPPAEYEAEAMAYIEELSYGERATWEQQLALLQALSLAATDVKIEGEAKATGTLGLYQPDRQRFLVRGNEMNPLVAETAVHELTHALHDQYYDLGRLALFPEDGQAEMLKALTEGDAERMALAYRAGLTEGDYIVGAEAAKRANKEITAAFDHVKATGLPDVLAVFGAAPYTLGQAMATAIVAAEEDAGLDAVFSDLPESAEGLLDPLAVIQGQQPVTLRMPKLLAGETKVDDGQIGPLAWYVTLAARIAPHRAWDAAHGWAGDAMVVYAREGRHCVRASFRGDTAADVDQMLGALAEWASTLPAGAASAVRTANGLRLDACDRGATPPVRGPEVLVLPMLRSAILAGAFGTAPPGAVACIADQVVVQTGFDVMLDPAAAPPPPWTSDLNLLVAPCVGPAASS